MTAPLIRHRKAALASEDMYISNLESVKKAIPNASHFRLRMLDVVHL
jgi:hypothetical protein